MLYDKEFSEKIVNTINENDSGYMSDRGFNYNSSSYQEQVEVAKALEEAMGSDLIRKAYFTNQPELIRS